jgi:hypothetical protein
MWSVVLTRTRRSGSSGMILVALVVAGVAGAACPGCADPPAQVRLVQLGGDCARPAGGSLVKVTAYTAGGERSETVALDESLAIASFPADTEQIGVEVITGGGAIGAAGKSAPLAFAELGDGATIPVFMAPPDGFCEVGAMTEERARPLVARAGDGVLVVGGEGASGPLATAEYYNRATATFTPVPVPAGIVDEAQGFAGAALATLSDGRVALVGGAGNGFAVFDPATRTFVIDGALPETRAFHAAIAVGDDDVLVAGGCSAVTEAQCAGVQRRQLLRYSPDALDEPDSALPITADDRIGARLFDLGVQVGGRHEYLLIGGSGEPDIADRFAVDDATTAELAGGHAQPVELDGGAVLAAFGDDGAATPASGAAAIYAPGAPAGRPIARAPDLKFVRLIALEDGRVAGFGGNDPMGRVLSYDPTRDAWDLEALPASSDRPGALTGPALARLPDGTVLVTGGSISNQAWLYRPSLIGPASGSITVVPGSDTGRAVLTAPDPATLTRMASPQAWLLAAPAAPVSGAAPDAMPARALVGGPRIATGSVLAIVHVLAGGVALIAQQTAPGQAIVAELAPDQPPRLVRLVAGVPSVVCSGSPALPAFDPEAAVTLRLAISASDVRLSLGDRELLACDLAVSERGSWGVAALGAGARITVDSVTVAR